MPKFILQFPDTSYIKLEHKSSELILRYDLFWQLIDEMSKSSSANSKVIEFNQFSLVFINALKWYPKQEKLPEFYSVTVDQNLSLKSIKNKVNKFDMPFDGSSPTYQ